MDFNKLIARIKITGDEFRQIPAIFEFQCRTCSSVDIEYRPIQGLMGEQYHCKGCDSVWNVGVTN